MDLLVGGLYKNLSKKWTDLTQFHESLYLTVPLYKAME